MRILVLTSAALLAGCGASPARKACTAEFTGNFADGSTGEPTCASLEQADAGARGWSLRFRAEAPTANTTLTGAIGLGAAPHAGTLTSQSSDEEWSARATREPGCIYSAGTRAVPRGSFILVLDPVDSVSGLVHGRLELHQIVHALQLTDCGAGDTETVQLEF